LIFIKVSAPRIGLGLEGDLLPFGQSMKARTLDGANVNKSVRPTIVRLNKAKAFLAVEPLGQLMGLVSSSTA
jgi:hypothetical protein